MKTVSTKELEGAALDWAVAKAIGLDLFTCGAGTLRSGGRAEPWEPSENWAQGGPLIKRYCLGVCWVKQSVGNSWFCAKDFNISGPTPLIAAMRGIVSAELGDIVEIPEQLL